MRILHSTHPDDYRGLDHDALRDRFVVSELFAPGEIKFVYSHDDRMVIGAACPEPGSSLVLETYPPLRSRYFCERRELVVAAVDAGVVIVDAQRFELEPDDVLYVGRGSTDIRFEAAPAGGARFYLLSAIAGERYPTRLVRRADAAMAAAGTRIGSNERTIYRYIHEAGAPSSQLVVGITTLEAGSVWNSMPPHLHDRRTEVYLYKGLPAKGRILHVMGEPSDTRQLMLSNLDAVVAPSWSVHFGAGDGNYSFVWAMAGENQDFGDMDQIAFDELG